MAQQLRVSTVLAEDPRWGLKGADTEPKSLSPASAGHGTQYMYHTHTHNLK